MGEYRCIMCRYWVVMDDAVVTTRYGGCICVRCYKRAVGDEHPMPKELRRWITAAAQGG